MRAIASAAGCRNIGVVWAVYDTSRMALDFDSCDRGQMLLMPPSLREWLPEDHLVWTVLGAVEEMDLTGFKRGIGWMGRVGRRMTRR